MNDRFKRWFFWPLNDTAINAILNRFNAAPLQSVSVADRPTIRKQTGNYPSTIDGREQGMPNFLQKITGNFEYTESASQKTSEVAEFMLRDK